MGHHDTGDGVVGLDEILVGFPAGDGYGIAVETELHRLADYHGEKVVAQHFDDGRVSGEFLLLRMRYCDGFLLGLDASSG